MISPVIGASGMVPSVIRARSIDTAVSSVSQYWLILPTLRPAMPEKRLAVGSEFNERIDSSCLDGRSIEWSLASFCTGINAGLGIESESVSSSVPSYLSVWLGSS